MWDYEGLSVTLQACAVGRAARVVARNRTNGTCSLFALAPRLELTERCGLRSDNGLIIGNSQCVKETSKVVILAKWRPLSKKARA